MRVRYAIIADRDPRSVQLSLQSVRAVAAGARAIKLVLVENAAQRFNRQSLSSVFLDDVDQRWISWHESPHRAAVSALREMASEEDIGVILRSGVVLASNAQAELSNLFERQERTALIWSLSRHRRLNELSEDELRTNDPWSLLNDLDADPTSSSIFKARCLRPCLFALRISDLGLNEFQQFSSLPDWYAYQHFFRGARRPLHVLDVMAPTIGYIGEMADRRNPAEQGAMVTKKIYSMMMGHPEFEKDLRADLRTLVEVNIKSMADPRLAVRCTKFLAGMMSARRDAMMLRKTLAEAAIN